ncbi:MAG: hypothetical protein CMP39_00235 [Rickettsiales bacterium]|nr:hypothetical protein [Rickettsiales bacterium]|tara:strand:+ start:3307 stop:4017 length:711 start_codon:yes stop_codon:yes gene_type:complete
MARPHFWVVLLLSFCFSGLVLAEKPVDLKEYLLNKSFEKSIKNKNYEKALSEITKLLELAPDNKRYHYNLGQLNMLLEEFEKALSSYKSAQFSNLKSLDQDSLLALGTSNLAANNVDAAIDIYKEILKKDPSNIIARKNLEIALALKNTPPPEQNQDGEQEDSNASPNNENENKNDDDDAASNEKDQELEPEGEEFEDLDKQKTLELLQLLAPDEEEVKRKYTQKNLQKVTDDNDW